MRIPNEFKLKGKRWRVLYEVNPVEDEVDCDGLCDTDKREIILRKSLKGKYKQSVFLHELTHAMLFEAHINAGVPFSEGVEEVICDANADLLTTSFSLKWKKKRK